MPTISVIIPTRDRAGLIDFAIDSLKRQTFTDWECWIVDDGSTDQSERVISALTASDSRFYYVKRPPLGSGAARNYAVELANGTYICFLDSDDGYQRDGLSQLHQAIAGNPAAQLVYANYEVHDLTTGKRRQFDSFAPPPRPDLFKCFIKPRGNPILPSASIVRTTAFREIGQFDTFFETSQTVEFWGRFVERFEIAYLDCTTSIYRRHDGQVTRNVPQQQLKRLFFYDEIGLRAIKRLTIDVLFPDGSPRLVADQIEHFAKELYGSPFPIFRTCLELGRIAQDLHFSSSRQRLIDYLRTNTLQIVAGRLGIPNDQLGDQYSGFWTEHQLE